jgi:hypothetical protein
MTIDRSLGQFQDDFTAALWRTDRNTPRHAVASGTWMEQPGFAVYRNTVMAACVDALEANFPSVAWLAGKEWMRVCAQEYLRTEPPRDGSLLHYGEGFPAFLQATAQGEHKTYLPDVARLDRYWIECHASGDEEALRAQDLALLQPDELAGKRLRPHASSRWTWSSEAPVFSIWEGARRGLEDFSQLVWKPEGALLARPASSVKWCVFDQAGCAFLDACRGGASLGEAGDAALAVETETGIDLAALFVQLLTVGAFSRFIE